MKFNISTSERQSDKLQDAISLCSSEHGAVYKSLKILLNLFTYDFRDFFIYRCFSSHHDVLPDFSKVHAPHPGGRWSITLRTHRPTSDPLCRHSSDSWIFHKHGDGADDRLIIGDRRTLADPDQRRTPPTGLHWSPPETDGITSTAWADFSK